MLRIDPVEVLGEAPENIFVVEWAHGCISLMVTGCRAEALVSAIYVAMIGGTKITGASQMIEYELL